MLRRLRPWGVIMGGGLLLYFNSQTTGNPFLVPYNLELNVPLGFRSAGPLGRHTLLRALENTSSNILGINEWLTGLYSGSLFFLIILLFLDDKIEKWNRVLLLSCAALGIFYLFAFWQDVNLGPRYYYPAAPILLLMIVKILRPQSSDLSNNRKILNALLLVSFCLFLALKLVSFIRSMEIDQTSIPGTLRQAMDSSEKQLIFIDQDLTQDLINWNDPFLSKPVILCRDLGDRNYEAISAFPDHQPFYFRISLDVDGLSSAARLGLYETTSSKVPGRINMFGLAAMFEATRTATDKDKDFFDMAYIYFFNSDPASLQQAVLNKMKETKSEPQYKSNFRMGLIHTAQLLLLPRIAFESKNEASESTLDTADLRRQLESAIQYFRSSGDIGNVPLEQMNRIKIRIDKNGDGFCSDREIMKYLTPKMRLLLARKLGV